MSEALNQEAHIADSSPIDRKYLADLAAAVERRRVFEAAVNAIPLDDFETSLKQFNALTKTYNEETVALGERAMKLDKIALAVLSYKLRDSDATDESVIQRAGPYTYDVRQAQQNVDRGYRLFHLKDLLAMWSPKSLADPKNAKDVAKIREEITKLEKELASQ